MNIDVIIRIEDNQNDTDIFFNDVFVPEIIEKKITDSHPETKIFYSVPSDYNGRLKSLSNTFIRENSDDINFWKNFFNFYQITKCGSNKWRLSFF